MYTESHSTTNGKILTQKWVRLLSQLTKKRAYDLTVIFVTRSWLCVLTSGGMNNSGTRLSTIFPTFFSLQRTADIILGKNKQKQ